MAEAPILHHMKSSFQFNQELHEQFGGTLPYCFFFLALRPELAFLRALSMRSHAKSNFGNVEFPLYEIKPLNCVWPQGLETPQETPKPEAAAGVFGQGGTA